MVLGAASPNPTRSATALPLSLDTPPVVRATVHDVTGRQVRTLLDEYESQYAVAEHLHPGGSRYQDLAEAARIAEGFGYDEVNLNCGCPSERVQSGAFGACLMARPRLVADCVKATRDACTIPVTVKHRIGIDERDSYQELADFVGTVAEAGCEPDGGVVLVADIVYDVNEDGIYSDPTSGGGDPASPDQSYQSLLYVGERLGYFGTDFELPDYTLVLP